MILVWALSAGFWELSAIEAFSIIITQPHSRPVAWQDKKWKNKGDNESGGNCKESPGKEVEVVGACDERSTT